MGITKKPRVRANYKEFVSWRGMIDGCYNKNSSRYERHGGEGITVHKPWRKFANFLRSMGKCPEGHELGRRNKAGNYKPSNCLWVTRKDNINTRRWCYGKLEYQGREQYLSDWSKEFGIKHPTLIKRLNSGWTLEAALTKPVGERP